MAVWDEQSKCPETINNCHAKLMTTTGTVKDMARSGRPSTSRSEENVITVQEMITRSPKINAASSSLKWTNKAYNTYTVLHKELRVHFSPQKPHVV